MNSTSRAALQPPRLLRPLFAERVPAGFPSPAADYIESTLDLNELLVRDPLATFFVRVEGESMREAGIQSGAIAVVQAGLEWRQGDVVVAEIDGGFTIKHLFRVGNRFELRPANPDFPVIRIPDTAELRIFGVVTGVVLQLRK